MMWMTASNKLSTLAFHAATRFRMKTASDPNRMFSSLSRLYESKGPSSLATNEDLVERRLSANRAKRAARERTLQERVDKNLHVKRLLHSSNYTVPSLYAVKVWVDEDLRQEMKLSGREKRGRVFIEADSDGITSIKGLKGEMYGFFRALKRNTFLLTASYPTINPEDGSFASVSPNENSWHIETDEDVVKTFQAAANFFEESTEGELKRPSIQINVLKDPNAPPPPPQPAYLENMVDPNESETITMLSFYAFPPSGIEDPEAFAFDLKKKWKPFQALGRVYVAQEGVNAQMSVPTNVLENFMECCRSVPELGAYMENDINIDPKPLSSEEFAVAGVPIHGKPAPPFRNLHVRVRSQVVADGLGKSLDWQSAGYDMRRYSWFRYFVFQKFQKRLL